MSLSSIIKDKKFLPAGEARVDARKRLPIGKAIKHAEHLYRVYENSLGQIILDPMEMIARHELWLYKNPKAMTSVMRGIEQASKGELENSPEEFSKFASEGAKD